MSAEVAFKGRLAAEKNNERLWPVFQQFLASSDDLSRFVSTADKLAQWCSVDKAYYAQARPVVRSRPCGPVFPR